MSNALLAPPPLPWQRAADRRDLAPRTPPVDLREPALVVGLARSGLAVAKFLAGQGAGVRVCDQKPADELREFLEQLPPGVETVLGGYDESVLDGVTTVYPSPGVWWDDPLLERARARRVHVSSEMDLFFRLCPAPIVGITGTNGKTTTTELVGRLLSRGDRPVLVGGNTGDTVIDRLGEITADHTVVLELSSFQIESIEKPRPHVAVVLNVTRDHLDRHHTFESYSALKRKLVEFQQPDDWAVLNGRDALVRSFADTTRARVVWFDQHQPLPELKLPGRHNLENALAAAAVARICGVSDAAAAEELAAFEGVEHRIELVGEWDGVRWFNDSKATNPESGVVALRAFEGVPLVLIAGGYGSGFDQREWLDEIRHRAAAVVLIGRSTPELAEALRGGPPLRQAGSLEEAVELARAAAHPGGVVLLSPGYKSFDMFRDFEDRGRQFKAAVRRTHEKGGRLHGAD
jgi:UDP-N-acetylmuramoylalanine--D-glutamate ligase